MPTFLNNKSILITGGTGSFGKHFSKHIIEKYSDVKKLVIFSRDELKQSEMQKTIPKNFVSKIRFFIGDVRDKERLNRALDDIDIVIHAAALKHVPISEYNPFEFIKTNVIGAQNLIDAALDKRVSNLIALSTDKAVSPVNLYGATKLAADKLFVSSNSIIGKRKIKISVVRYGNVFGSRGSVVPLFLNLKKNEKFPITHESMTRFNISLDEAVNFVLWSLRKNIGGEIFIPKLPSYKIFDLIKAINTKFSYKIIGIRPGEKIYEELVSKMESLNTYDLGNCYSIVDRSHARVIKEYRKKKIKKVRIGFEYNSSNNKDFLTVKKLKKLIEQFKNPLI